MRLIDDQGQQVGVVKTDDALRFAQERDLDLVEVAPDAQPPVCRVLDYSKYKYEQAQKVKAARKHQQQITVREIKFRPKIAQHDFETKRGHVERFLRNKDKVKVTIMFRGREVTHPDRGVAILDRLAEELAPLSVVEQRPMQDGRNMTMMLGPSKAVLAGRADEIPASRDGERAARTRNGGRSARASEQPRAVADESSASEQPRAVADESTASEQPGAVADESTASEQAGAVADESTASEQAGAVADESTASEQAGAVADESSASEQPGAVADESTASEQAGTVVEQSPAEQKGAVAEESSPAEHPAAGEEPATDNQPPAAEQPDAAKQTHAGEQPDAADEQPDAPPRAQQQPHRNSASPGGREPAGADGRAPAGVPAGAGVSAAPEQPVAAEGVPTRRN